jgi:DNA polymerase-3 subunit gamma/tau
VALALYRKYRPRTFSEVIGQEHVTEPLMQALRTGRVNHAYLFSGPRGCGKTSSARILARSLNCAKGPTPEPCGECDSCLALAPDGPGSIDVIEIDAASHGGVDDARDLRERAFFAPVAGRYKVYVIDEAHMVSSAGFNALLKLVEEPPDYVTFVFATTEPEKVLGTIKSRTHHYPFRLVPPGVLRPFLESLCEREGISVEPAVFPLVVRAGAGSVRDSLSVLDQLIAGAGPAGVSYARAVALLGVTDAALIDEMCDALAAGDGAGAYTAIDRVVEAGHDPRRFASDLLERLRDLIVLQQVPDAAAKGLLDGSDDELARMSEQARRFGSATLSRLADIVHNGLTEMRGTTAPRLLLELVCARMLLPGADDSPAALLQRLERLERRATTWGGDARTAPAAPPTAALPTGAESRQPPVATAQAGPPPPPPPAAATPLAAGPQPAATPAVTPPAAATPLRPPAPAEGGTGVVDAVTVRRHWDEILTAVRQRKRSAEALLREAAVREVQGDTLILLFKHGFHANSVAADPRLLLDAVHEVFGGAWRVRCEVSGQAPSPAPAGSAASGPQAAMRPAAAQRPAEALRATEPPPHAAEPPSRAAEAPSRAAEAASRAAGASRATGASPSEARGGDQASAGEDEWPATARPGGQDSRQQGGPAGEAQPSGQERQGGPARRLSAGGAAAAARAATNRSGTGRGGRNVPPRQAPPRQATPEAWPDMPPYDPEYDPPVRDPRGYEGFDPGDEPLDDEVAGQAAAQTSEQQALQLLQQALGAEKIGE